MISRSDLPVTTDGMIFTINMATALQHQWLQFHRSARDWGHVDSILDGELAMAQFRGDFRALERLVDMASTLLSTRPEAPQSHLVGARVDAVRHEFAAARKKLQRARELGAVGADSARLALSIDQAVGDNPRRLFKARELNMESGAASDAAALGALLAERGEIREAERVYEEGLKRYTDPSPLGPALLCFQLGVLWGETAAEQDTDKARYWYRNGLDYLPGYVSAGVHLSELAIKEGKLDEAETLLVAASSSHDPEVHWRMSELMAARGHHAGAVRERAAASVMYAELLDHHFLAFADHAAEFFMDIDPNRALQLAEANLRNRNTPRSRQLAAEAAKASEVAGSHDTSLAQGEIVT